MQDFPGGSVVKNPPADAGDIGLTPGPGTRIPHAVGQLLSLYTLEPVLYNKWSHCDKPVQCNTVMKTAYSPPVKKNLECNCVGHRKFHQKWDMLIKFWSNLL